MGVHLVITKSFKIYFLSLLINYSLTIIDIVYLFNILDSLMLKLVFNGFSGNAEGIRCVYQDA